MQINIYTDGGSRGNPGHSGYGLVVYNDSKKVLFKQVSLTIFVKFWNIIEGFQFP